VTPVLLATLYRQALEEGQVRKIGEGVVRGHQVVVLESRLGQGRMRAALDSHTFELVRLQAFDGAVLQSQLDVLRMDSLSRAQAHLPASGKSLGSGYTYSSGFASSAGTISLGAARRAFPRPPLWAGVAVHGHHLATVAIWKTEAQPEGGRPVHADVLHLGYGPDKRPGSMPFLEIEEAPASRAAPLWRVDGDYPPPAGYIDLRSSRASQGTGTRMRLQWTGLMRKGGFYIRLTSWDRATMLAAARGLAPIRPR
jgi:hypothetical protein